MNLRITGWFGRSSALSFGHFAEQNGKTNKREKKQRKKRRIITTDCYRRAYPVTTDRKKV
jgi:hypothetical protein